jgi:hypothetical protein
LDPKFGEGVRARLRGVEVENDMSPPPPALSGAIGIAECSCFGGSVGSGGDWCRSGAWGESAYEGWMCEGLVGGKAGEATVSELLRFSAGVLLSKPQAAAEGVSIPAPPCEGVEGT